MRVHLVTFSDESMSRAAELCISSGLRFGCADYDHLHAASLKYHDFYKENESLLSRPRGVGYWAWKPYLIQHALEFGPDGSHVVYADAGIQFIGPVSHIIDRMDQDIFLFGNNWEHAHWCKRDVIDEVWPLEYAMKHSKGGLALQYRVGSTYDEKGNLVPTPPPPFPNGLSWSMFGKQCQASVIFFRVSDYTRAFVAEWLKWCLFEGGRLIDDSPSRAPNHPEFQEHRHDQAILTTMAYREGIRLHYWPASYNDGAFCYEKLPEYAGDNYPILFNHHRRRNHEWPIGARYVGHALDGEKYSA